MKPAALRSASLALAIGLAASGRPLFAAEHEERAPAEHVVEHVEHVEHASAELAEHANHHAGPPPWRVGAFGLGVPGFDLHEGAGPIASGGGGLFLKWEATHAVTLGAIVHALAVPAESAIEVPVDLIVEFPFHLTERVHPYFGVGASFSALIHRAPSEEPTRLSLGVIAAGGCEVWVARRVALFGEISLAYLRALDGPASALQPGGAAGVLFAFGR